MPQPLNVLLLTAERHDADAITAALRNAGYLGSVKVCQLGESLQGQDIDCIVVPLKGDTADCSEIIHGQSTAPRAPVVVLVEDEQQGMKSIACGATDYVLFDELNESAFKRAIANAMARHRVRQQAATIPEELADRIAELFTWTPSATAANYGQVTLQSADTDRFERFLAKFDSLIDRCIEQKTYRVPQDVSLELSDMALSLGQLRCGPRDVVEIYGTALKRRLPKESLSRAAALVDAGQLTALELMGYLVSYYRNLSRISAVLAKESDG